MDEDRNEAADEASRINVRRVRVRRVVCCVTADQENRHMREDVEAKQLSEKREEGYGQSANVALDDEIAREAPHLMTGC